jgi:hypothetical protein
MGTNTMKKKKNGSKRLKILMQGLPIAAAAGSALLPVQRLGQQLIMLIVLLWIQVFFIVECFLGNK